MRKDLQGSSNPTGHRLPTFSDIKKAAERLQTIVHRTPVLTSRTANTLLGAELFFKAENMQRTGAFKFRGASNAIAALTDSERAKGVIAYSSGNHAQAVAYAAQLQGVSATIIMPHDAPEIKVAATKGYGAKIIGYDRYRENREEIGRKLASESGAALIPPYDHPDVIAGQGTAALELFAEVGDLDVILVCLGGGGSLAGWGLVAKHLCPKCVVAGVEPEAGNRGQLSLQKGELVTIPVPKSIADGALVSHLGKHNFPIIQSCVDDIVTVTDQQLINSMKFFAERMKIVVEPTGCLAVAAALNSLYPLSGKRVGVLLSGGNVDLQAYAKFLMQ